MFDRFASTSRKALALSRRAVHDLGHEVIASEHILIGLLQVEGGHRALLTACKLDPDDLLAHVRFVTSVHQRPVAPDDLGTVAFAPQSKTVLERTVEEADRHGAATVEPEHLLLGLLAETEGDGGALLRARGLTLAAARSALVSTAAQPAVTPPAVTPPAVTPPAVPAAPADVAAQLFELSLACRDLQRAQARQEQLLVGLHRAVARLLVASALGLIGIVGLVVVALVSHAR
jgi:ATP-dependent Clp protease ATP-binding subunit ClpA